MILNREQAKKIALKAFPDYKGRKFHFAEKEQIDTSYNANWCEGTRTYYKFVRLSDGAVMDNPNEPLAPWARDYHSNTEKAILPDGLACVTHTIFCGHDTGCCVYTRSQMVIA